MERSRENSVVLPLIAATTFLASVWLLGSTGDSIEEVQFEPQIGETIETEDCSPSALSESVIFDHEAETKMLEKYNQTRANEGLGELTLSCALRDESREHALEMLEAGELFDNSGLSTLHLKGLDWVLMSKQHGRGKNVDKIFKGVMGDTEMRKGAVNSEMKCIGIGVIRASEYDVLFSSTRIAQIQSGEC